MARPPAWTGQHSNVDYGSRIVFHGAMDNQHTLPFGSVDDVRQEVRDNLSILGAEGGYVLGPCHDLQVVTPVENVPGDVRRRLRRGLAVVHIPPSRRAHIVPEI